VGIRLAVGNMQLAKAPPIKWRRVKTGPGTAYPPQPPFSPFTACPHGKTAALMRAMDLTINA
jgi:hypothetical protein